MGCSLLSTVQSIAAAGCCAGIPVPGVSSIAGGLSGSLGGALGSIPGAGALGSIPGAGAIAGGVSGLAGGALPGLGIPASLSSVCSSFTNGGLSGLAQQCLGACGPAVQGALGQLPGALTGMCSGGLQSLIPAGMNFPTSNLVDGVMGQAQSFLKNGVPGLTECITSAKAFCENGFNLSGSLMQAASFNIAGGDLGHKFTSMADLCTGGVTKAFGDITGDAFNSLKGALPNFGAMVDPSNLIQSFTPAGLVENLTNQGFGDKFLGALENHGVALESLSSANPKDILAAISEVPSGVVEKIVDATGYKTADGSVLGSLTDIFNPVVTLGEKASSAINNSLSSLSNSLTDVVGDTFDADNWQHVGGFLSEVESPDLNYLKDLGSDTTRYQSVLNPPELNNLIGAGTGIFGNPVMTDIMGSVIGAGFISQIATMTSVQDKLINTDQGAALRTALETAYNNRDNEFYDQEYANDILAAAEPFINPATEELRDELNAANRAFEEVFHRLLLEKKNLAVAGIVPEEIKGSAASVMGFVGDLHSVHNDEAQLGIREFIEQAAAPNIYGEAIKAAIVEGKNIAVMRQRGIEFVRLTDPVAYAQEITNRTVSGRCCP
jgi:hypothetical protein